MSIFSPDWQGIDVELGIFREQPKQPADIRGTSNAGLMLCAFPTVFDEVFGTGVPEMCRVPSAQEIAADTSSYGPALSQESRDQATAMTLEQLAADCRTHPYLYEGIPGSCSYKEPQNLMPLFLLAGAVALFMVARH